MKKDELTTRFNSVVTADKIDLDAARTLLSEIEADYDDRDSLSTTLNSFKTDNDNLKAENSKLRETNMKFYMMLAGEAEDKHEDNPPANLEHEEEPDPEKGIDDLISAMLGKKGEE